MCVCVCTCLSCSLVYYVYSKSPHVLGESCCPVHVLYCSATFYCLQRKYAAPPPLAGRNFSSLRFCSVVWSDCVVVSGAKFRKYGCWDSANVWVRLCTRLPSTRDWVALRNWLGWGLRLSLGQAVGSWLLRRHDCWYWAGPSVMILILHWYYCYIDLFEDYISLRKY